MGGGGANVVLAGMSVAVPRFQPSLERRMRWVRLMERGQFVNCRYGGAAFCEIAVGAYRHADSPASNNPVNLF